MEKIYSEEKNEFQLVNQKHGTRELSILNNRIVLFNLQGRPGILKYGCKLCCRFDLSIQLLILEQEIRCRRMSSSPIPPLSVDPSITIVYRESNQSKQVGLI